MIKHTPEQQCMLDMMEIVGFPMQIMHGLYTMKFEDWTVRHSPTRDGLVSTSNFDNVVKTFERWKAERNED